MNNINEKTSLDLAFFIDNISVEGIVTGALLVTSNLSLKLDEINAIIYFEARGKMSSNKTKILNFIIATEVSVIKNKKNKIPFAFQLPTGTRDSYEGVNVSFNYKYKIDLVVCKNDIDKVERDIFSKIKSFLTTSRSISFSEYFKVLYEKENYEVLPTNSKLKLNNSYFKFIVILIFLSFFSFLISSNMAIIFFVVLTFLILLYVTRKYLENRFGEVAVQISPDRKSFICKLHKTKKFSLKKTQMYYQIIEKVIDKRGTDSSTYLNTIYTSESKKVESFRETIELTYYYPEKRGLSTYNYNDVSIYWEMILVGEFLGISLKYKCMFDVIKN